jgi:hypothetical protein
MLVLHRARQRRMWDCSASWHMNQGVRRGRQKRSQCWSHDAARLAVIHTELWPTKLICLSQSRLNQQSGHSDDTCTLSGGWTPAAVHAACAFNDEEVHGLWFTDPYASQDSETGMPHVYQPPAAAVVPAACWGPAHWGDSMSPATHKLHVGSSRAAVH